MPFKNVDKIIFFLILSIPFFWNLNSYPILIWDEARLAINALEMHLSNNFLVTTFNGAVDTWNTKPPLMIWFQVFFIKLLGVSELSVRIPSVLAILSICLVFYYALKELKLDKRYFYFYSGIFLTTGGLFVRHMARTGDYDALLSLFIFSYSICLFLYLENKNKKYLLFFGLFLTLAGLTKGIAAYMIFPGLFIYTVIYKIKSLRDLNIYIYAFVGFGLTLIFYFLREKAMPGFLKQVNENELIGRFFSTKENHLEPFNFYFLILFEKQLSYTSYFIIPSIFFRLLKSEQSKENRLFDFCFIMSISFLLVISSSKTKLYWYDLPSIPFMAFCFAYGANKLLEFFRLGKYKVIVLLAVLIPAYNNILNPYPYIVNGNGWTDVLSYKLKEGIINQKSFPDEITAIALSPYHPVYDFYSRLLAIKTMKRVKVRTVDEIEVSDLNILVDAREKDEIKALTEMGYEITWTVDRVSLMQKI